ncbi:MAG TPA: PP2C family protein-serine/threonine phosphatase [Anaerolineales bacterium]|nr:PP2C family protein-serine/threonine phosphatase [Anaerolineales bacterium]
MSLPAMSASIPPEPQDLFERVACRLRPEIGALPAPERAGKANQVVGVLLRLPMATVGLIWLAAASKGTLPPEAWKFAAVSTALLFPLAIWTFYFVLDLGQRGGGLYGRASNSLEPILRWAAALTLGPIFLWAALAAHLALIFHEWRREADADLRNRLWELADAVLFSTTTLTLLSLIALWVYRLSGGTHPPEGWTMSLALRGLAATGVHFALETLLIWATSLGYNLWKLRERLTASMWRSIGQLHLMSAGAWLLEALIAAPLAGLYVEHGLAPFLFFACLLLGAAWMAHRLSRAVEESRTRHAQMERLEALGRALLNAPPDSRLLPDLLLEYAPGMFTFHRMAIWRGDGSLLLRRPDSWDAADLERVHAWLKANPQARVFPSRASLPWLASGMSQTHNPILLAPLLDVESGAPAGGVYVELSSFTQASTRRALEGMLPAVQALAAQVASALHREVVHARALAHQRTQTELEFARRIQMGFLPSSLPELRGWQLAAALEPAREMSGDFYDVVPLRSERVGLLIADVADKGIGPALYMALARTLLRAFAVQWEDDLAAMFRAANERILQDAQDPLFITVFYGVLDPRNGSLTYVNAGHNPPLLWRAASQRVETLARTGAALGAMEDLEWETRRVDIAPADILLLYTDGVTEAENAAGEAFGLERLLNCLHRHGGQDVCELPQVILNAVRAFRGETSPFDDMTLLAARRCE